MDKEKRIEVVTVPVSDLKNGFGNPRKIKKKKRQQLADSIETFGDFGIFIIDENYNVIGGNQRWSVIVEKNPDTMVTCKMLIGYSEAELRAINIKDNTHAGDWDLDLLANWTADLNVDLGIDPQLVNPEERTVKSMELIHNEKYDYVLIVCKNKLDYEELRRKLGIDGVTVKRNERKARVAARAVWYDKVKDRLFG